MRTPLAALATLLLAATGSPACTFCGEGPRARQTLRTQFAQAKVVLHGQLKNPRFDPKTDNGFTDLHVTAVLRDDPARGGQTVVTLRKYLPVIGNTPPDYLVFCGVANGRLDPTYGVAATPALVEYLKAAAVLDDADPAKKLGFFFAHLDSADPVIAADAFIEFARASDAEILKARDRFSPAAVRKLIADPNTPTERIGVFAFLLGVCGGPADAAYLAGLLTPTPLPHRTEEAFGGLLAGYILLDPKPGWAFAAAVLGDSQRGYAIRLSALGTVRFLQAARGAACKAEVVACCAALLPQGDLADQAVEDLRRWGWWDLTADVLAQFGKPTHAAPIVRRAIVRYAVSCPDPRARAFVALLRQTEPKLVADVEEQVRQFDLVKPR
ncbi:MAG: hypothetical protein K2P78_09360 [Gemmataceae bacterium]|nr:hypothetical protein [Gemmataceae bacterium]